MATMKADIRPIGRPQASSARRRSRSWLSDQPGHPSLALLVVGEEDLLQGRMGEFEVGDRVTGDRLDHSVEVAGDVERDPAVLGAEIADAGDRTQLLQIDRLGELDRGAALRLAEQVGDPLDRDQPAVADDPDPVADPLDLVQLVRGDEDGAATLAFLARRGRGTPPASAGRGRWSARRGSAARARGREPGSARPSGGCRARADPAGGRGRPGSAGRAPRRGRGRSTPRRRASSARASRPLACLP